MPSFKVSCVYSLSRQFVFWLVVWFFVALSYLGGCHPEDPFVLLSWLLSVGIVFLFSFFKGFWLDSFFSFRVKRVLVLF